MHVNPTLDQDSFRGRNDDGSESTATWKAAANTNWSQATDEIFRVRFLIQEDSGGSLNNQAFSLQYRKNGGTWTAVAAQGATSDAVRYADSTNVADGDATTQQLGSGTFVAGSVEEVDPSVSISFAGNDETELEYVLEIYSGQAAGGDTIDLRVVKSDSTLLDTYTNTPAITVSAGAVTLTPAPVVATWAVPAATVSPGPVTITATPVVANWAVVEPTLIQTLTPSPTVSNWVVPTATVTPGPFTISPTPVTASFVVPAATVSPGPVTLSPASTVATWNVPAPTLILTLTPSPVSASWVVPAATVSPGPVTLSPASTQASWVVPSPTLTIGGVTLTPASVLANWVAPTPTITAGGVTLTPASVTAAWVVPVATIISSGGVTTQVMIIN
jgi:hypothetical protein